MDGTTAGDGGRGTGDGGRCIAANVFFGAVQSH